MNNLKVTRKRIWLKGGIIGAVISAILILVYYLIPTLQEESFIFFSPVAIPLIFFGLFHGYITSGIFGVDPYMGPSSMIGSFMLLTFLPIISVIIFYFLIGAIVGKIYEKIKGAKK